MKKQMLFFTMLIFIFLIQNNVLAAPVTIDSTGDVGMHPSMITINNHTAISYYDATNKELKYIRASNLSGTAWDTPVTLDSTGKVGKFISMAIVSGNPAVSYYDSTKGDLKYIRASDAAGTSWDTPVTLDSTGDVGEYSSMTIVNNNPAISYYDKTNGDLKFIRASNSSGTAWSTPVTVDSTNNVGMFSSVAIVKTHPAISYCDSTSGNLKYIRASNSNGTSWEAPIVLDSTGFVGEYTSMVIANDRPAISYYDKTKADLKYIRASDLTGTAWDIPVIVDYGGSVGGFTSMTIIKGSPAISYHDTTNNNLKYVKASDPNGTIWDTPAIMDSTGDVGEYTSIAILDGHAAISYYDKTNGDLKYVKQLNLYFPQVKDFQKLQWSTEICIINNSGSENMTGTVKFYSRSGSLVRSEPVNLNKNGRKSFSVEGMGFIDYCIFTTNSLTACGYAKLHKISGKFKTAIPATSHLTTKDIYVPHIASCDQWWTVLTLLNTTSSPKTLNIEFNNHKTKVINLMGYGHREAYVSDLFSGVPQPDIKSAVIKNTNGVIALEFFGNKGTDKNYASGILLKDETSENIYFPHITSNTAWWTGIAAYNPANSPARLTIMPYKKDGTALNNQSITVQGITKYIGTPGTLNLPTGTEWLHIAADKPITGFELFGTVNGNQLGGYTVVKINDKTGVFPKLEKNGWTGIALVNLENSPASVLMTARNDAGTSIATKHLSLGPHEKIVNLAANLFGEDISTATYVTYSSNRQIVGFQLNGSNDGMLLDALPGN